MMFDFFISDPHFFHKKIIEYCHRPFSSVEEMNEAMIENYNKVVKSSDHVLWCGDSFFGGNEKSRKIMDRLNGKKSLVLGNHDSSPYNMASRGFEMVVNEIYLRIAGRNVTICHYDQWKFRSPWDNRYQELRPTIGPDEILIHGHTHQKTPLLLNQVNVGVDAWKFAPVAFEEVETIIKSMKPTIEGDPDQVLLLNYRAAVIERASMNAIDATWAAEDLMERKYDKFRSLGWESEVRKERSM
jgi:calcineurin-like phosphoesterase family protein